MRPASPADHATTRDLGLLIRDRLEGDVMQTYSESAGELVERDEQDRVSFVDVADPHNPVAYLESGARFRISIIKLA